MCYLALNKHIPLLYTLMQICQVFFYIFLHYLQNNLFYAWQICNWWYNSTRGFPVGLTSSNYVPLKVYLKVTLITPWDMPKLVYNGFEVFSYVDVYEYPPTPPVPLRPLIVFWKLSQINKYFLMMELELAVLPKLPNRINIPGVYFVIS